MADMNQELQNSEDELQGEVEGDTMYMYIFVVMYVLLLLLLLVLVWYYHYQDRPRRMPGRRPDSDHSDKPPPYQLLFFSDNPPEYGAIRRP